MVPSLRDAPARYGLALASAVALLSCGSRPSSDLTDSVGGNSSTTGGGGNATGGKGGAGNVVTQGGNTTGMASGGTPTATGGANASSGGVSNGGAGSGGKANASSGGKASGGAQSAGGTQSQGGSAGASAGGKASGGAGGNANSDAVTTISNWLRPVATSSVRGCLPYGSPSGDTKTQIVDAIIAACEQFGPPESTNPGWKQQYCWAHLVGAILVESSYDVTAINEPGSDPTVGLLQDRFSSTVCEMYTQGPKSRLEAMGCTFPSDFAAHASEQCNSTFWRTTGGDAAHTQWLQIPACNIGLGAWYYYTYATGGGNSSSVVYTYQYCHNTGASGPQPANLVAGLMSHLMGPSTSFANIANMADVPSSATDYISSIKTVFDCAIGSVSGTHPFFIKLQPNPAQYCPP